jgi:hypothetical protein
MKNRDIIIICLLFVFLNKANAQLDTVNNHGRFPYTRVPDDTLFFFSNKVSLMYTFHRTINLHNKFFNMGDTVFNDSLNIYSKLRITKEDYKDIWISTIPIDNVIIDDVNELILCLSRAINSPYHIVLYNFDGDILFKKFINDYQLKLDTTSFIQFKDSFPDFFKYAFNHNQISFVDKFYYVDISYIRTLTQLQRDKIWDLGWSEYTLNFQLESYVGGNPYPYYLKKFSYYSLTDPFYEYIFQKEKLVGIVLNDMYGGKILIPVSY